jgi:hypothetical protein
MYIKQVNSKEYDVFIGSGWENHLRVTLAHSERKAVPVTVENHVEVTPKLLELIYYKIKKQQAYDNRNKSLSQVR